MFGCTQPSIDLGVSQNDNSSSEDNLPTITSDVSIEYLKSLYNGNTSLITKDIAIEGVITANDAFGEFPTSLIIEDDSGAIEIMCDFDCATSGFIFGATIKVLCSGLWLGATGGMLALGATPQEEYIVGLLSEVERSLHLQICNNNTIIPIPTITTIDNLNANHILRYVLIEKLYVDESDTTRTFCSRNSDSGATEYTEHTLVDIWGSTITLSVDRNVRYADDDLPEGSFSTYAIVEYFGEEYRLRLTNCGYQ